jgi:hypothetical protein
MHRKWLCVLAWFLAGFALVSAEAQRPPFSRPMPGANFHATTQWAVQPSLKYDALCALDMLSGDPYYLKFYQADYNRLAPQLTLAEKSEFVALKRIIKDKNKGIVSADLALLLSVEPGDTLDDLLTALSKPNEIQERLRRTPYYSPANFQEFLQVRPHAIAAIRALKRIGFDADWAKNIRPNILARIAVVQPQLTKYNIVPLQEQVLGHALPDNRITVYLLYYSQPHGIKITGTRYLTHFEYPFEIVLHNAVHEMLHPPYDLRDAATVNAIELLRHDAFLLNKVQHHNPSFGYNEFEGFVEEDCVQALEQAITQYMGVNDDKQAYWRRQDDGMHVLAIALYVLMEREDFMARRETFPHFLERMVLNGRLTNARLIELNREFYAPSRAAGR